MTAAQPDRLRPLEISDEPMINAVHRAAVELTFAAYAALLVYVSFVPFDFTKPSPRPASHVIVLGLAAVRSGIPDVLANVAVYVPLGALAFAVCRRRKLGRVLSIIPSLFLAVILSFLVEQGQRWIGSRVASFIDVTANSLGALFGATLIALCEGRVRRVAERARWAARRNWWLTLCKAAVCLVLALQLRPYDLVVDAKRTVVNLVRHGNVSPLARWKELPAIAAQQAKQGRIHGTHELVRVQWEYGIDRAVDVAAYAAVAALAVVGLAPQFTSSLGLYFWAGFISVSLAMMVTVIRIFLISQGLDTMHFCCGLVGWPIGCLIGMAVLRRLQHAHVAAPDLSDEGDQLPKRAQCRRHLPAWHWGAIAFAFAAVVAYETIPCDFATRPDGWWLAPVNGVCWLPFLAHFHSRPNDAFFDISGDLLRYTVVGVCLAFILARREEQSWRRQLCMTVLLTGAICLVLEGQHIYMPTRQADVTTLILALGGGFIGAVSLRWMNDYRESLPVLIAEDLLTSQLVEGETYKKLPTDVRQKRSALSDHQAGDAP
jgi:VanZ family protein